MSVDLGDFLFYQLNLNIADGVFIVFDFDFDFLSDEACLDKLHLIKAIFQVLRAIGAISFGINIIDFAIRHMNLHIWFNNRSMSAGNKKSIR